MNVGLEFLLGHAQFLKNTFLTCDNANFHAQSQTDCTQTSIYAFILPNPPFHIKQMHNHNSKLMKMKWKLHEIAIKSKLHGIFFKNM